MEQKNLDNTVTYSFPKDFIWAGATSAFQVEGATRQGGRGPSIWDTFVKIPGTIINNGTADIACDSYHKFREDVKLLKELRVDAYRFSISWSRIFPNGTEDSLNMEGVQYYHDLIDEMILHGIKPIATIYHWDLPQTLQDRGGWLNRKIIDWFAEFAKFCFAVYGSKVHHWITLNEPYVQSVYGYNSTHTKHAPQVYSHDSSTMYLAAHHMLLAHATVYRLYDSHYKKNQKGVVGITNVLVWSEPSDPSNTGDALAANELLEAQFGWFTDPLISGDYPLSLRKHVWKESQKTGRVSSLLPEFTEEEKHFMKGTLDFIGVNYYISVKVKFDQEKSNLANVVSDTFGIYAYYDPAWERFGDSWMVNTPFGMYKGLKYIRDRYDNIPVMITENGCIDKPSEGLNDVSRVRYMSSHIAAVGKAMSEGCNVIGYTAWSPIDNFEWSKDYSYRFGLYHVNFNDPSRTRTAKESSKWYKKTITNKRVKITKEDDEFIRNELPH